jgi:hypothetical protein
LRGGVGTQVRARQAGQGKADGERKAVQDTAKQGRSRQAGRVRQGRVWRQSKAGLDRQAG